MPARNQNRKYVRAHWLKMSENRVVKAARPSCCSEEAWGAWAGVRAASLGGSQRGGCSRVGCESETGCLNNVSQRFRKNRKGLKYHEEGHRPARVHQEQGGVSLGSLLGGLLFVYTASVTGKP